MRSATLAIARLSIGRGSPFKVVVKPRFSGRCFASLALFRLRLNRAQIADSPRGRGRRGRRSSTLAAAFGGALRAVHIPKTERGAFPTKRACRESAALGFPPPAGVAPSIGTLPLRGEAGRKPREGGGRFCEVGTTPRTTNRPRGRRLSASLFSRLCWSLRGRLMDDPRRARESYARPRIARRDNAKTSMDGGRGAVGVVARQFQDTSRSVLIDKPKHRGSFWGAGGTWRCVATRVKHSRA